MCRKPPYYLLKKINWSFYSFGAVLVVIVCCEFKSCSGEVYSIQWLAAGQWLSPGTPVSSSNKTDQHDITEILLKVALNTITLILAFRQNYNMFNFDASMSISLNYG